MSTVLKPMCEWQMQDRLKDLDEMISSPGWNSDIDPCPIAFPGLLGKLDAQIEWIEDTPNGNVFNFSFKENGQVVGVQAHRINDQWFIVQGPGLHISTLEGKPWYPYPIEGTLQ